MTDQMFFLAGVTYSDAELMEWASGLSGLGLFVLIGFFINVVVSILLYLCFSAIPREHRALEPGLCFLLLIPILELVWNFIVFMQLSNSYRNYFEASGRSIKGDYGKMIGIWYAVTAISCIIPCLGCLGFPASIILLVLYMVKAFTLRGLILRGAMP